jgi:hypothetical protein
MIFDFCVSIYLCVCFLCNGSEQINYPVANMVKIKAFLALLMSYGYSGVMIRILPIVVVLWQFMNPDIALSKIDPIPKPSVNQGRIISRNFNDL